MKSLPTKAAVNILLVCIFISGIVFPDHTKASDRDVDPYLIYIDPVTGKYTTQKPGHASANQTLPSDSQTGSTAVDKPRAEIVPVLTLSGGMLLFSYLIALFLKIIRKNVNANQ